MTYRCGEYGISVEQIDGLGKKPGLYILKENEAYKMASFGSEEKAGLFCKWLEYFLFGDEVPEMKRIGSTLYVKEGGKGDDQGPV